MDETQCGGIDIRAEGAAEEDGPRQGAAAKPGQKELKCNDGVRIKLGTRVVPVQPTHVWVLLQDRSLTAPVHVDVRR